MKTLLFIAALLMMPTLTNVSHAQNHSAPVFSVVIPDLPLMAGMIEYEDNVVMFDKPEGRIIQLSTSVAGSSAQDISDFYAQSLRQLGWKSAETHAYIRGQESLTISYESDSDDIGVIVTFTLQPR